LDDLDDPAGQDIDAVRLILDEIQARVRDLLTELELPQPALADTRPVVDARLGQPLGYGSKPPFF
jgi:hypothetical protein